MLDFYRKLRLSPKADEGEIRAALVTIEQPLRDRMSAILLDGNKRKAYDHAYTAMKKISQIRTDLQIIDSETWTGVHSREWQAEERQRHNPTTHADSSTSSATSSTNQPSLSFRIGRAIGRDPILLVFILFIVGSLIALVTCSKPKQPSEVVDSQQYKVSPQSYRTEQPEIAANTFNEPVQPTPEHGTVFVKRGRSVSELILRNQNATDMYFKLVDVNRNKVVRSFYLSRGLDCTVRVPSGLFKLYASSGETWYGPEFGFGQDARCIVFDQEFDYRAHEDGQQPYYELLLYGVPNGNTTKSTVYSSDFDSLQ